MSLQSHKNKRPDEAREGDLHYFPRIDGRKYQENPKSDMIAAMNYASREAERLSWLSHNKASKPQNLRPSGDRKVSHYSQLKHPERPAEMDYVIVATELLKPTRRDMVTLPSYEFMRPDSPESSCSNSGTDDTTLMTTFKSVRLTPSTSKSSRSSQGKSSSSSSSAQGKHLTERSQLSPVSSFETPSKLGCIPTSEQANGHAHPHFSSGEAEKEVRTGEPMTSRKSLEKVPLLEHPYFKTSVGDSQDLRPFEVVRASVLSRDRGRAFRASRQARSSSQTD